jgi:hypothetical protein
MIMTLLENITLPNRHTIVQHPLACAIKVTTVTFYETLYVLSMR